MSFASLGLAPALVRAADLQGALAPTPVQAQAIPAVLQGRDLLALAPTGSGKTLAYALPLLQRLQVARRPWPHRTQALVLLPTRELAQQVGEVIAALARSLPEPPKVVTAHGGVSINPQLMALRGGAELVVATPGRLLDLLDHRGLRLQALNCVVLDEADRLLEAGFADEWARIRAALPGGPGRRLQHLLFSATLPAEVEALAAATGQADGGSGPPPRRIDLREGAEAPPPDITQRTIAVDTGRRSGLLRQLLTQGAGSADWDRVLVFVASRYATELVAHKLQRHGIAAAALHGELSQGARNAALADFRAGRLRVLVATDLAARGLDIVDLPVVINFDLPRSTEDYTHRIGRTGRAGAHGLAISFVPAAAEAHMRLIEKRRGERLEREVLPGFEPQETAPPPVAQDGNGGVKGRRPSKKDKLRAAAAAAAEAATRRAGTGPRRP